MNLKQTIEALIAPALTAPCAVHIDTQTDTTFIRLTPSSADVARLIGRQGATFRHLKTLVEYLADEDHTYRFVISDPTPGPKAPSIERNASWKPDRIVPAVQAYLAALEEPTGVQTTCRDGEHLLILAARMPEDVWTALSKWITVCALTQGGYASLEIFAIATA